MGLFEVHVLLENVVYRHRFRGAATDCSLRDALQKKKLDDPKVVNAISGALAGA